MRKLAAHPRAVASTNATYQIRWSLVWVWCECEPLCEGDCLIECATITYNKVSIKHLNQNISNRCSHMKASLCFVPKRNVLANILVCRHLNKRCRLLLRRQTSNSATSKGIAFIAAFVKVNTYLRSSKLLIIYSHSVSVFRIPRLWHVYLKKNCYELSLLYNCNVRNIQNICCSPKLNLNGLLLLKKFYHWVLS